MAMVPERKLAVILHADVVDSTALVQANETVAHRRIQATFRRLSETISRFGGVAREIRGDAIVAEFQRASDALAAALVFQNSTTGEDGRPHAEPAPALRVGIAMGEVVVADGTVTGAGVVLAQRLEQVAEPGGVCIQGAAQETVPERMPFDYESLGERRLKGFDKEVRVYAVTLRAGAGLPRTENEVPAEAGGRSPDRRPSIVILPFTNMSENDDEEYFSDGLTDDLITALSRFDWLLVIARNSAFAYKKRNVEIKKIGQDLGVRYVLEGSVRRVGDRVRVNAQLVDAQGEGHVWAERYDRQLVDVFELQDDIVANIAATVVPEITRAEIERARTNRPSVLSAWDEYLRALAAFHRMTEEDIEACIVHLENAVEIDPQFARALALLSRAHAATGEYGWRRPARDAIERAQELAEKATRLAPSSAEASHALAYVLMVSGRAAEAVDVARRALDLNPNFAEAEAALGLALVFVGDPREGLAAARRAARSNPRDRRGSWCYEAMGWAHFMLDDFEQSIAVSERGLQDDPTKYGALVRLAASHARLGHREEAKRYVDRLRLLIPRYSLRALRKNPMFLDLAHIEKLTESLRLAGLPE